ncbi:MAG: NAD-binding protein [Steroidobacteraceae bacterium]
MKHIPLLDLRADLKRLRGLQRAPGARILFIRPALGALSVLGLRALIVLGLFGTALLAFYLDRAGLRDALDGHLSFSDIVYFTLVTVTTVGYGDIVPVSDSARMLDALLVTPIRVLVWFVFIGTAYQLVIQRVIEDWRMQRLQQRLVDHVVICGFSNSGRSAIAELLSEGVAPEQIVVIERDESVLALAMERGVVVLHGDATREEMLRVAGVERARGLIVSVARDDAALMIVVTARAIGANARIVASVHERENVKLLRNAGANVIITPWTYSGYLLADGITQQYTVDIIQDALSHEGHLRLHERAPRAQEIGLLARELPNALLYGLVRKGERMMFWQHPGLRVTQGDLLIVMDVEIET